MTTDAAREVGPAPMAARDLWTTIVVIAATWGTAFAFIRVLATDGVPPFAIAALRALGTAAALLLWFAATRRTIRIDRVTVRHMAVLGLLNGLIPNFLAALALAGGAVVLLGVWAVNTGRRKPTVGDRRRAAVA